METAVLSYFLKASIVSALLFGLYFLLFRKDTFFVAKRFYLLFSILFSAVVPLVSIQLTTKQAVSIPSTWLSEVIITPQGKAVLENAPTAIGWHSVLLAISLVISLVLLLRTGLQIFEICRLRFRNLSRQESGYELIHASSKSISPFSFFRWIFVGGDIWETAGGNQIVEHETVHVRQWHSADVILSEVFCIAFWWNPFAWLFRREIRINHEYLADKGVIGRGENRQNYQYLLLNTLIVTNRIPLNNYFNVSQLKQRIAMMNKKQSPLLAASKYLLALPLAALLIIGNSVQASDSKKEKVNTTSMLANDTVKIIVSDIPDNKSLAESNIAKKKDTIHIIVKDKPITQPEIMPQFPGGEKALMEYLSNTIKYPEVAIKNNIQGRVTVRFVVSEAGKVIDINVLKGISPECDAEAVRVVEAMPTWTPGKDKGKIVPVYYTLPISFRLTGDGKPKTLSLNDDNFDKALVLADGYVLSKDEFKTINVNNIKKISILKPSSPSTKSILEKYGEQGKGKESVIMIEMKKE